ncbi:OB-fold nucleic acid binding domain-containing protein [Propionibacterium cyclohexanicum]|uniref:OB-fold nucleic acid binding domain-containing protein n=1 Tax=Propionibacterium cyclohexanicum TaxID=64702 RepID=UPI001FE09915|nr:OB-fold nucleic acid binding domain-containing protein [Propionibacterium cyclohexanicum]
MISSDRELESEELVDEAIRSGATPIGEVGDRQRVTVQGTVSVVTLNPNERHHWLEAELTDGSGTVKLIWMGRHTISGVDPGRRLRVEGLVNHDGRTAIIYNPRYKLLA